MAGFPTRAKVVIIGLGGIVGAMIIALYMPIFSVFDLIQ